jgi:DNA-binding NarL/FixJ family response regulator
MGKIYNIILVDDHNLFRDALKFVLAKSNSFKVIAEASNGFEFLEILDTFYPDLVLIDISMPVCNGIDATREARKKHPELKIIALSMYSNETYYYKMLEAGAQGFVLKEAGSEELFKAMSMVINGENYFSNEILCKIIKDHFQKEEFSKDTIIQEVKLSKRENEILGLICDGCSNNEIAFKLGISRRTIEGHRSSILKKTGAKNSISLVLFSKKDQIHNN